MSYQRALEEERGFTLVEVIVTILLMGIVFAIAIPIWSDVSESRRVDSGTNRLAADLRHAHSRAINRLEPQTVTLNAGSSNYTMTGVTDPVDLDDDDCSEEDAAADLCDEEDLVVPDVPDAEWSVAFCPNGSAEIPPSTPDICSAAPSGDPTTITVGTPPDPTLEDPNHTIQINPVTSRIQVVP